MIILANILSYVGNILFTSSSLFKKKTLIVTLQSINHVLSALADIIMKAFSGASQEALSLVRDFILLFIKEDKKTLKLVVSLICIALQILTGVLLNIFLSGNVWYGYLPVIGTIIYSTFIVWGYFLSNPLNSEMIIKIGLIGNGIVWSIYGVYVNLIAITIFNIITIILCIISIIRILINKHQLKELKMN